MYDPPTPESAYVTQISAKRPARSQTAKRVRLTEKSKQQKYSDLLFSLTVLQLNFNLQKL